MNTYVLVGIFFILVFFGVKKIMSIYRDNKDFGEEKEYVSDQAKYEERKKHERKDIKDLKRKLEIVREDDSEREPEDVEKYWNDNN
jgi:flagellar biosynthesis/type III secretory pathway M-ring protein FliF/YscJ